MSLDAPPSPDRTEITHAGVRWRARTSLANVQVAGTAVALMVGLPTSALAFYLHRAPESLLAGLVFGPLCGLLLAATQLRWHTVEVRPDRLVVEARSLFGRTRHELLYRELTAARLLRSHADHTPDSLLLATRDLRLKVGDGSLTAQLQWMEAAIDEAVQRFAAREQAEGREFFFHRQTPEALAKLKGRQPEKP